MIALDARRLQANLAIRQDGQIGPDTLRALFARMGAAPSIAGELGLSAAVHFRAYGILDNALRLIHFLAQTAHESGGYRWMEELASGDAYEGRAALGNTQHGDGRRYKGRGPLQLTGRANYRLHGRRVGIDFEGRPELVAIPSIGLLAACSYWDARNLNALSDADDLLGLTRAINGGENGLPDRRARTSRVREIVL